MLRWLFGLFGYVRFRPRQDAFGPVWLPKKLISQLAQVARPHKCSGRVAAQAAIRAFLDQSPETQDFYIQDMLNNERIED